MKSTSWSEIAEYLSLAGSALGTVAAVATKQAVYAAAPMTLALGLNIVNRRQFQQQIDNNIQSGLAQTNQIVQALNKEVQTLPDINTQIKSLSQEFTSRPEKQEIEEYKLTVAQLADQVNAIVLRVERLSVPPDIDLNRIQEEISNINIQLDSIPRLLNERADSQTFAEAQNAIAEINERLNRLNQEFNNRQEIQVIDLLQTAIVQLTEQLNATALRLDRLPPPSSIDLNNVGVEIANINSKLESLKVKVNNISTAPNLEVTTIEQAIANLSSHLDSLYQQFNNRPEPQEIGELAKQVNALMLLLNQPQPTPGVDISGIETAIAQLNHQINELQQQFNQRPETQIVTELAAQLDTISNQPTTPRVDVSNIETAIVYLTTQLDEIHQQFNDQNQGQTTEQFQIIEEAISDIYEQIDTLTSRLEASLHPELIEQIQVGTTRIANQNNDISSLLDRSLIDEEIIENDLPETTQKTKTDTTISGSEQEVSPIIPDSELSEEDRLFLDINRQLDALTQQFNNQPETQAIKQLQTTIDRIQQQINNIALRLGNLPSPLDVDVRALEEVFTDINSQLNNLNQQLNERPEIQSIEQLGQAISQLTDQLTSTIFASSSGATPLDKEGISDIEFQLNAMALCMENLPTPPTINLSGIETTIFQINNNLDTIKQQSDTQAVAQAVEQLESAIGELINQIDIVASHLNNLPAPSEIGFDEEEPNIADLQW